ncbi:MAG TPA: aminotransferase class III-fold pyridoxal phosphate-dependent enzyme [Caulobacteraceae bacterium]
MAKAAFIAESPPRARAERVRSLGCRVWDADGEARIDFDMGGGAIVLGHAHLVVEAAVADVPSDAEEAAADALVSLLPAAEAVRFSAAESQALPAAIAAARRVTGRRRVLACSPPNGPFGDTDDLAAVVIDPLGVDPTDLTAARELADAAGALLIFDEGASGFRVHANGAQGMGGVLPDLSVHGAAIANGRPLGAVAGRASLVSELDDEDLPPARPQSLAAAAATLHVLAEYPVAPQLRVLGAELQAEVGRIVEASSAQRFFALHGDPTLPAPLFAAPQLEGLWLREMAAAGFIVVGPHAISAAHGEAEVAMLIAAYARIIPAMTAKGLLESLLRRPPQPFAGYP